jgi:hypothetical protein
MARIMRVLIEWSPTQKRVTVRGCWPDKEYKPLPPLENGNVQHAVQCFEGHDHGYHVGFSGLVAE